MLSLKKVLPLVKSLTLNNGEATSALAGVSSGFLGALVGGFIAGAMVLLVKKYVKVPRSLEGAKSILLLPLFGTILTGFVMLAVNIPMAAINTGMNNFLGGLEGGSAVLLGLARRRYDGCRYGWTS